MRNGADRQARGSQRGLGLSNPEDPVMENTGGEQPRGASARPFDEMAQFTNTA